MGFDFHTSRFVLIPAILLVLASGNFTRLFSVRVSSAIFMEILGHFAMVFQDVKGFDFSSIHSHSIEI